MAPREPPAFIVERARVGASVARRTRRGREEIIPMLLACAEVSARNEHWSGVAWLLLEIAELTDHAGALSDRIWDATFAAEDLAEGRGSEESVELVRTLISERVADFAHERLSTI